MSIVLHAFPPSPRAFKVLFAANHLGLEYRLRFVDLVAGEQRAPEFAALNPNRCMPVLVDGDYVLWESNAILEYFAAQRPESNFLPQDARTRLQASKWLYWESAHWDPACAIFIFERVVKPALKMGETAQSEIARGTGLFNRLAGILDSEFDRHRYVGGETLTAADFAIVSPMCCAERAGFPLEDYPAIRRWIGEMQALPAWHETIAMQARAN
jgi:glutathione S-transferase